MAFFFFFFGGGGYVGGFEEDGRFTSGMASGEIGKALIRG